MRVFPPAEKRQTEIDEERNCGEYEPLAGRHVRRSE